MVAAVVASQPGLSCTLSCMAVHSFAELGTVCYLQRILLWERRNNVVFPFNETVQQVFSRISAFRDSLDGPQVRRPRCDPAVFALCIVVILPAAN